MNEITQDYVRELFDYRDGNLYWKVSRGRAHIGNRAGSIEKSGYLRIGINGKLYKAHRLIFLWYYGYLPQFLDHIDGNGLNNSIGNLRKATTRENSMNNKKQKSYCGKTTSSQFKGVSRDAQRKKWRVYIQIYGKNKFIGRFTSEIDAALAYDKAAIKYHGKYARTNAMMFPEIFKDYRP